jgi:hypothetical protein
MANRGGVAIFNGANNVVANNTLNYNFNAASRSNLAAPSSICPTTARPAPAIGGRLRAVCYGSRVRTLQVLVAALSVSSPVSAKFRLGPGLIKELARRGEASRFVDAGKGLAIVAEQCGDSDSPPPMPRRACGCFASAGAQIQERQNRRRTAGVVDCAS